MTSVALIPSRPIAAYQLGLFGWTCPGCRHENACRGDIGKKEQCELCEETFTISEFHYDDGSIVRPKGVMA